MMCSFQEDSDLPTKAEIMSDLSTQTSPLRLGSYGLNGQKQKRISSITPRKFSRFFTPRSQGSLASSPCRRTLFDITPSANNQNRTQSSPSRPSKNLSGQGSSPTSFTRDLKRRKLQHNPSNSPEPSSYTQRQLGISALNSEYKSGEEDSDVVTPMISQIPDKILDECLGQFPPRRSVKPVIPFESRGLAGGLLSLSLGSTSLSRRHHLANHISDWENETATFFSTANDRHISTSMDGLDSCIPFSVASCNTNSLVAIGDEEGRIRILESARTGKPDFKDVYLAFRPHTNAVIDLCFSRDDSLLATASGDQTAKLVDMATQTTISVLAKHSASLKQVKFQPGSANNSIVGTSSRDGSVQIWDLRCKGSMRPVQNIHVSLDRADALLKGSRRRWINYGCAVNSIYDAHRPTHGRGSQPGATSDGPSRGEAHGRVGDVSVTAIEFLPEGREHLLLTASEANSSVKLWDVRSLHNTRRKTAMPLSYTAQPRSHTQWRDFGINSMNLGGDGSRLYTLCKDNTVYIHSVAHLMLGQAPELSTGTAVRRRKPTELQEGLGPLYGFRHPQLHATSFYVKSAIRPARNGKVEMLAVGSSDGCAILFPTDERYHSQNLTNDLEGQRPCLRRVGSGLGPSNIDNSIPISQHGTPLIRGHEREVGALTWTSEGELVTLGDDFIARCWREGTSARDLRFGGETGGRRWGCGWADVSAAQDDDDE